MEMGNYESGDIKLEDLNIDLLKEIDSIEKIDEVFNVKLFEDGTDTYGWNKVTIDYCQRNRNRLIRKIKELYRKISRTGEFISTYDAEEIYSDMINYFFRNEDYDVDKAVSYSEKDELHIITIDEYVIHIAKYFIKRFQIAVARKMSSEVRSYVKANNKDESEISLIDNIEDKCSTAEFEKPLCDLELICKECEPFRYSDGFDCFAMIYVQLLGRARGKSEEYSGMCKMLMDIEDKVESRKSKTFEILKEVSNYSDEEAINIIRKYVYGAEKIDESLVIMEM